MKKFKLNGKEITPKAITFNTICDLEDMGFDIATMSDRTFSFVRVFVQIWGGYTKEEAGNEIEAHLAEGGTIDGITEAIAEAINESSFFNKGEKKSPKLRKTPEPTEKDS